MIKVLFTSHHFKDDETFLKSILKMTPGQSGVWNDVEATLDPAKADFYAIFDGCRSELPHAKDKAIYMGQHPHTPYSPVHKMFEGKQALIKLPLKYYLNPGEWWIPHTYDELSKMEAPFKPRQLFICHTYQTHHPMYIQRPKFTAALLSQFPHLDVELYGRPSAKFKSDSTLSKYYKGVLGIEAYDALKGEHIIGKETLINFGYSLEYDVGPCVNYFSERLYDSLLLWCFPFYFGCTNLDTYLPRGSYEYFNQNDTVNAPKKIADCIFSDLTINRRETIAEARYLLLNRYQTWAYVDRVVHNINKYKESNKSYGIK